MPPKLRAFAPNSPALLVIVMFGLAIAVLTDNLTGYGSLLRTAFWAPDTTDVRQVIFFYSFLPRASVSLLAGAMLGLSGLIFQQVLRNPIVEPTTLGVLSGAHLAMIAGALWLPGGMTISPEWVAFTGAIGAFGITFALATARGLAATSLILAGLIVSLFFGACASVLTLFNTETLTSIFVWGSGSLTQDSWNSTMFLLPRLVAGLSVCAVLMRPLSVFALDESGVRSIGVPPNVIRSAALLVAVLLASSVVSSVGVIGFIGLAAPNVARAAGARVWRQLFLWTPIIGAALLFLADQVMQLLTTPIQDWPTGIATGLIGSVLLLCMLLRRPTAHMPSAASSEPIRRMRFSGKTVVLCLIALCALPLVSLSAGQTPDGWHWGNGAEFVMLSQFRAPRLIAAVAAGAMLAIAGVVMQRLTANPMASPEALGVSSGAAYGVILLTLVVPTPDIGTQVGAAAAGALVSLLAMLAMSRRAGYSPERMLLIGSAVCTAVGALTSMLVASGDPRMAMLLSWMAGSTYQVTLASALLALFLAMLALPAMPLFSRWLEILPLGDASCRSVGISLGTSRLLLLLVTALLAGAATLIVGPLSFVGLMAPNMARMMGLRRAMPQIYGSAALGALIMVLADWLGRNILFPYQIPAGLLATFIGGPYFVWLLAKRAR